MFYSMNRGRFSVQMNWGRFSVHTRRSLLVAVMSVGRKHDNLDDIFKDIIDEAVLLRDPSAP